MNKADILKAFEELLAKRGVDPEGAREGEGWYRFELEGGELEGGLHPEEFRLSLTLCEMEPDVDLTGLGRDLQAANRGREETRFDEADGYLEAVATCPLAQVSGDRIQSMLEAVLALAGSPAAEKLVLKYRSPDDD
jgi:hypothetical protein